MKKSLRKETKLYWVDETGERHYAEFKNITGDVSGLYGNVSELTGDVSGLRGDVSGLRGNVDECNLTKEDRARGVDVSELIEEQL